MRRTAIHTGLHATPAGIFVAMTLLALTTTACSSERAVESVDTATPTDTAPDTTPLRTTPAPATAPPSTQPVSTPQATTEPPAALPSTSELPTTDPSAAGPYEVVTIDGEFIDVERDRRIPYRVFAPAGPTGATPVILVSHGGDGSAIGHLSGAHLGTTFATGGYLAIHIGHLESAPGSRHLDDRPADVTAVLDQLDIGSIALPSGFTGTVDTTRIGHAGHSFGAYTSHAVGGADYGPGSATYRDERIDAIAPISPQGAGQFGAFDNGADENTWMTIDIPAYNLIGGAEIDSNAVDSVLVPDWRLTPFRNYPAAGDKFVTVIDGQGHSDMWRTGSDDVEAFIASQITLFFDVYVANDPNADACQIGRRADLDVATETDVLADASGSTRLVACS